MIKTKNLLIHNIKNPKTFFDILLSIPNEVYLKKILILVNEEIKIDYFLLANKAINDNYEVFKLPIILEKLTFISILNSNTLLSLYKDLSALHYEYITLNITENIFKTDEKFSYELFDYMSKNSSAYMISHISILLIAFHTKKSQYTVIRNFLENTNTYLKESAIEAIRSISISLKEAKEILNIFFHIQKENNERLDINIITSCNIIKKEYFIFEELLSSYSFYKSSEIKYSISKVLLLNKKEDIEKEWFKKYLFSLSYINKENKELLRNLSFILNNIINEKNEYKIIIDFFILWSKNSKIEKNFPEKELSFFIKNFINKDIFQDFKKDILIDNNKELLSILSFFK